MQGDYDYIDYIVTDIQQGAVLHLEVMAGGGGLRSLAVKKIVCNVSD
jgi:hypothetical protein